MSFDHAIRSLAFEYVAATTNDGADPTTWAELKAFHVGGDQIHLVTAAKGIFKPRLLDLPISIRTTPPDEDGFRPYDDEITADAFLRYRYRGTDPNHSDNRLLREAMDAGAPLMYFEGIAEGLYNVHGAVITEDHPEILSFDLALMPIGAAAVGIVNNLDSAGRRHYLAVAKKRAGQQAFRQSVLRAYRKRCTLCRLRHTELLDAAHIVPDAAGGLSIVTNGLSMCKIHHAAFDANLIGVRPDMVAEVRSDVLEERDGPMLEHGIQAVHGLKLIVPSRASWRPDSGGLELRYETFRQAG